MQTFVLDSEFSAEVTAAPGAAQPAANLPDHEEKDIDQKVSQRVMMEQSQMSEPFDGGMEVSEADKEERGQADVGEGLSLQYPAVEVWMPSGLPLAWWRAPLRPRVRQRRPARCRRPVAGLGCWAPLRFRGR
ncbi:unnamed protein product [Prorocentrum cordatum]|uniref:Uncharacterized protein n=1 Tax=Prorocentrum cordatum TaxID=2364126 RepID=A0ABN9VWY6_9DINO|nr:unnamed protein product [Polarella glacialis]